MRLGSLFSGVGGLDLAAVNVLDAEIAWVCESDRQAASVLEQRVIAPNIGDITTVHWADVEPVDVITAGFPCQDISNRGLKAGMKGHRSELWSYAVDAVYELRPSLLIVENVAAIVGRGLDVVLSDLAKIGYDAEWECVPATAAGAPHKRDRLFLIATDPNAQRREWSGYAWQRGEGLTDPGLATADSSRWGQYSPIVTQWEQVTGRSVPSPTEPNKYGKYVLSPRFAEWVMGLPDGWVTDIKDMSRRQQLQLLGNAVVPQQAELALGQLLRELQTEKVAA